MYKIDYYAKCEFGNHRPPESKGNIEFYDSELDLIIKRLREKHSNKINQLINGEPWYNFDNGTVISRDTQPRITLRSSDKDKLVLLMADAGLIRGIDQIEEV